MYTVAKLAKQLDVNVQTIYKWIREDKLKTTRIGGGDRPRVRITDEQYNEFMAS